MAGTSRAEINEHLDTQSALVRQMNQMQQMMGTIMDKMQKWEAYEQEQIAVESETVDSPARGRRSNIPELTVNSARGEETHSGERDMRKKSPEPTAASSARGEESHGDKTDTDSELCVPVPKTKESGLNVDVLTLLAADLEREKAAGPAVNEKLAEISKSRFCQKMAESKLKDKMNKYPVPENCLDVSPPTLNSELTEKGYVDRTTKKADRRLVNVQTMLSAATACLLVETNSLHEYATDLAGDLSKGRGHAVSGGRAASALERGLTRANQTLAALGDAIAILGMHG